MDGETFLLVDGEATLSWAVTWCTPPPGALPAAA
jgi:hypothetical protein